MRSKARYRNRGFSLVEVIVVLVVLAILAAIMIPAMTGWIRKAREKRLIMGCRTCVTAAQTLVAEEYGKTSQLQPPPPAETKTLARVAGDISGIQLMDNSAQIWHLTYSEDNETVTYCADAHHGDYYIFGATGIISDGHTWSQLIREYLLAARAAEGKSGAVAVDSEAPLGVTPVNENAFGGWTEKTLKLISQMITGEAAADAAAAQAALANANIRSWALRTNAGNSVFLSDQNITNASVGDYVRVIRCQSDGKFTLGYAKVGENSVTVKNEDGATPTIKYHTLGSNTESLNDYYARYGSTTYSSYEAALSAFNAMPLDKPA